MSEQQWVLEGQGGVVVAGVNRGRCRVLARRPCTAINHGPGDPLLEEALKVEMASPSSPPLVPTSIVIITITTALILTHHYTRSLPSTTITCTSFHSHRLAPSLSRPTLLLVPGLMRVTKAHSLLELMG